MIAASSPDVAALTGRKMLLLSDENHLLNRVFPSSTSLTYLWLSCCSLVAAYRPPSFETSKSGECELTSALSNFFCDVLHKRSGSTKPPDPFDVCGSWPSLDLVLLLQPPASSLNVPPPVAELGNSFRRVTIN
ncbi:unnamed protein product [Microthlaspi erraticum]|uniref:Uncharacterized protein n=1 Tax=Microthlaspi erraticum TaxID=1685480 RepID=A0A6D2IR22_9BRAS|nr:unnamed protein product [Microthlaspi erraticum]